MTDDQHDASKKFPDGGLLNWPTWSKTEAPTHEEVSLRFRTDPLFAARVKVIVGTLKKGGLLCDMDGSPDSIQEATALAASAMTLMVTT